jgi:hypothetical protein
MPEFGDIMPLKRGSVIGYDNGRMTFEFTMLTPEAEIVDCGISSVALDHLMGNKGALPQGRNAQFAELRDKIEQIASDIFDRERTNHIRIFSKHVDLPSRNKGARGTRP